MKKILERMPRWLPAVVIMSVIFISSSQPNYAMPLVLQDDEVLRKLGHLVGYALLALSFVHLLDYRPRAIWIAWVLTMLYACTDEYHQSFVPGRSASLLDIVLFDDLGALLGLLLYAQPWRRLRTA